MNTVLDISQREQLEAELFEYRKQVDALVEERTAELRAANEQLHRHVEWLSAIKRVTQIMTSSADFTKICEKITEIINTLFSSQDSFIVQMDAGRKQLKFLAHSCHDDLHPILIGSVTSLPDYVINDPDIEQGNLAIYTKDQLSSLSGPIGVHIRKHEIYTIVLVPLRLRERAFGFLGLEMHDRERILTRDESSLLNIFSFDIAQLIEDSRQYEQAKALIAAEERNRLARDLHDSVTQVLFSASLLAEVLPQIWRRNPELGLQRLDKLQRLTRGALAEMRTMLLELRPSAVLNTPLGDLLAQLTEAVAIRSGLPFRLFIERIPPLPEDVQMNFYRIAQEALNNVVKHAQAKHVTVSLSAIPLAVDAYGVKAHEFRLLIQDDGVGFYSENGQSAHLGISIMHERAAAIQAILKMKSEPGYGTLVSLIWSKESRAEDIDV
jgi:signal transduction histidine kinase